MEAAMSELRHDARSLVDAVLDADEPSADDAARVRAKVDARLSLIAAGTVAATVSPKASAAAGAGGAIGVSAGASAGISGGAAAGGSVAGGSVAGGGIAASATWMAAKIALGVALGGAALATSLVIGSPAGAPTSRTPSVPRAAPPAVLAPVRDRSTRVRDPSDTPGATRQDATRQKQPASARAPRPPGAAHATPSSSSARPRAARRNEAAPAPSSAPSTLADARTPDERTRAPEGSATRADAPAHAGVEPKPAPGSSKALDSIDAPTQGSATVSAPKDSVVEEAALLHAARGALAGGDARAALALLDEHGARFPKGALIAERQAARVFALCALGWSTEARRAASAFLAQNPRSPLAARVRNACAQPRSRP
jgi:hypothetical protein